MKLTERFKNAVKVFRNEYSVDDFDRYVRERIKGGGSHSGVTVNEDTAMKFVTVYSCVRVLAEAIASLPLFLYKTREGGGADKARDHHLYDLLHNQPNDEMTTVTWREQQIGNQALAGNSYSIITFNKAGQPIELYPVMWNMVDPFRDSDGKIKYRISDRGKQEVFPAEKVFHVPGLGFDGVKGLSAIQMASESIGAGMAAAQFSARFYGQGMNIGGVLQHPQGLSDKAYERLKEDVEARGTGLANSWRPLILEEGMTYNRIPMLLTDAQFIESRKFSRDEICGLFRVPPHMIANLERSTHNNIEHQSIEFVMHSLLPYLVKWEKAISWKLLTKEERAAGYYAKFNVDGLLRGDYKSRQEGLAIQRQNGAINADEWREMEERNPIGGEEGQAYLVNGNMIPITAAKGVGSNATD